MIADFVPAAVNSLSVSHGVARPFISVTYLFKGF
jgi:hypothetical protein